MNKKRKVLLVVIGIFILSLSIISTIAFFTAQILGNPTNNNARVNMNDLKLTFSDQTGLVEGNGITPGWTHQKIVTVENTGTASVTYDLVWLSIDNQITNNEMVYSITCSSNCNGLSQTPVPGKGENLQILTNTINSNETQTYTITFTFIETNAPQDYNQNKSFSGNIGILETNSYEEKYISDLLSTDWQYTLDTTNHKVTLTKYIGTNPSLIVYSYYTINNTEYSTVVDPNSIRGNSTIISVKLLGNIAFVNNSMAHLFDNCPNLTTVNLSKLSNSNVTSMDQMFNNSTHLTTVDFSNFNTSNVTDMSDMFLGCSSLTTVDLSSFDTSNVTDMSWMFRSSGITILNLSNFNTSNVTNMDQMFGYCYSLTTLDLSSFNTSKVTNMYSMFAEASNLTTIYASNSFDTTNVSNSNSMFAECSSLVGGNGTAYDSTKTDKTYARIDVSGTPGYFTAKPTQS